MRNIRFPPVDDKKEFHKIALAKRRKRGCSQCDDYDTDECDRCDNNNRVVMTKMEPYISHRYNYYEQHLDTLGNIKQEYILQSNQIELLLSTFKSNEFNHVRSLIINNLPNEIKGRCPFCMIGEPATLEHYLPKTLFPEYTLYSKNLVPCCHVCNSYKGIQYLNESGSRRYINYYIDDVEKNAFLKAKICLTNGIPTVDFTIDLDQGNTLYETIMSHFTCLHLGERYISRANSVLSSIMDAVVGMCSKDDKVEQIVEEAVPLLEIQFNTLVKQYGKNYWKASIYKGIIDNRDLFKDLVKTVLKEDNQMDKVTRQFRHQQ